MGIEQHLSLATRDPRTNIFARRPAIPSVAILRHVPWTLFGLILFTASIGIAVLYSAAGGQLEPWASRQLPRLAIGTVLMLAVSIVPVKFWFRAAYPIYFVGLCLLVLVNANGVTGMGARRWLDVGPLQIQPSELMKIAVVLALARFFHRTRPDDIMRPVHLVWPVLMVLVPAGLIVLQPKLGTAILVMMTAAAVFYCAGVRSLNFGLVALGAACAIPFVWGSLRDYQKQRVFTFLNPERDPLGAGYNIIQSKIALGSGGFWGKGFLNGTQSHLQFLPEMQTDFIFSAFAEEFGLVGGLSLIALYTAILAVGLLISVNAKSQFARLTALGVITSFYANAFVNLAMVMGLLPVVGEPLPFLSYGGTALISLLLGFGLIMNAKIYADERIGLTV